MLDEPLPPVPVDCAPWPGRVLRSGGVTLHVRETPGPTCEQVEGRDELAVYVHGLGGSATNFTDLAGLVATRVAGLAVDLPGFGRSEPERGFDYRLQSHATALGDFLAGLDPGPLHLVGNSMPRGNSSCCPAPATSPRWNDRRRWPARCSGCSTPTRAASGELRSACARYGRLKA